MRHRRYILVRVLLSIYVSFCVSLLVSLLLSISISLYGYELLLDKFAELSRTNNEEMENNKAEAAAVAALEVARALEKKQ